MHQYVILLPCRHYHLTTDVMFLKKWKHSDSKTTLLWFFSENEAMAFELSVFHRGQVALIKWIRRSESLVKNWIFDCTHHRLSVGFEILSSPVLSFNPKPPNHFTNMTGLMCHTLSYQLPKGFSQLETKTCWCCCTELTMKVKGSWLWQSSSWQCFHKNMFVDVWV